MQTLKMGRFTDEQITFGLKRADHKGQSICDKAGCTIQSDGLACVPQRHAPEFNTGLCEPDEFREKQSESQDKKVCITA